MEPHHGQSAIGPGDDPRAQARLLRQVRDVVLSGGRGPAAPRPVIGESWSRMRQVGLDPSGGQEIPVLDGAELRRRREASGLGDLMPLLRQRLLPAAEAAGQVMVVVDPEGRVLWREGGPSVRRRADALGFVEGSAWDESSVGTNAIGTSLVVGAPVHVFAAEHYAESHQPWTCAAAPLHDPVTGRLLGAVDLSGPAHTVHASTVALVDAVARLVELEVRAVHGQRHERLRAVAGPLLARLPDPAVVVGTDGCVAGATGVAPPPHLHLSAEMTEGSVHVPELGTVTAEALPGGWLLRVERGAERAQRRRSASSLLLDLRAAEAVVVVSGPSGRWSQAVSRRHAELLLAMSERPRGSSAAQLAEDLFGDGSRTVTVRAEISRLRRTLGPLLDRLPYRVAAGVVVTVRRPDRAVDLLAGSTAPVVEGLRRGRT